MSSLNTDFNELMERVRVGREFGHASFEPIFYLIFDPQKILKIKRQLPAWAAKLRNEGWDVHIFSMAKAVQEVFDEMPAFIKKTWEKQDSAALENRDSAENLGLQWQKTNKSLAEALTKKNALQNKLEAKLSDLEGKPNSILLVSDIEALHPYLRIGSMESQLQGKFHVPTIFFYPGMRTGKTQLKFLGFYPEDGNYRSVHVGG
ncbi:BREX protein BrxB domain-containing protein [Psychrobacter glacincola]|uniref:BREX protein BrxB domain-containing protein n=1 Tax=Psychrobacter glacincola TaxID=56810 RepID=A0ABW1W892_9GAMM|nr:BREX protein BrxB domain-containing protein [Psychrobacter glacincola]